MRKYTFIVSRTYETLVEVDADNYDDALCKLSETDIYSIELEQCCVVDEFVKDSEDNVIKDINFMH